MYSALCFLAVAYKKRAHKGKDGGRVKDACLLYMNCSYIIEKHKKGTRGWQITNHWPQPKQFPSEPSNWKSVSFCKSVDASMWAFVLALECNQDLMLKLLCSHNAILRKCGIRFICQTLEHVSWHQWSLHFEAVNRILIKLFNNVGASHGLRYLSGWIVVGKTSSISQMIWSLNTTEQSAWSTSIFHHAYLVSANYIWCSFFAGLFVIIFSKICVNCILINCSLPYRFLLLMQIY